MANRIIRDYTDSEKVDLLSPEAEVFYVRLFMKADDYGSCLANPKLLRASLFPLRLNQINEIDILKWRSECEDAKLIFLYEVKGKDYLRIVNFGQRLRNMKKTHPHPESDSNSRQLAATRGETPPLAANGRPETKRNETETETETETKRNEVQQRQDLIFSWYEKILVDQLLAESFCIVSRTELNEFVAAVEYFFMRNKAIEKWKDFTDFKTHFINWCPNWQTQKTKINGNKQSTFKDATGFRADNPHLKEYIEIKRREAMAE